MARTHKIEDYRNFGIMAHIDGGGGKPRRLSGSSILHRQISQKSVRSMTRAGHHGLDGVRSKSAASRSRRPRRPVSGVRSV